MHGLVCAVLIFMSCFTACADFCPPGSPRAGGMRDIMLCYMAEDRWAPADFRPYVAFLDKAHDGRPRDWFYDSFLFLMFGGAPSGGAYYNGSAIAADWRYYVDLLFSDGHNLAALNSCIRQLGAPLNDANHTCPVIIMIPYLDPDNDSFGDIDGDGNPEDARDPTARLRACRWLIDNVLRRWKDADYAHLQLWGFYWMHEGVTGQDASVVRDVARCAHENGMGLTWIPWFRAPGWDKWRDIGFDFAIMQPNFAFMETPPLAPVPDEHRLTRNANLARANGLGVEFEMNTGVASDPDQLLNLQLYINHSVDELDGTMHGAVRAYYQAYDLIAGLYRSDRPQCNRTYADLYAMHSGTYQRRRLSLCEGAESTVNGRPEPRLTDGLWLTSGRRHERVVSAKLPATVTVLPPQAQIVGDVRVHLVVDSERGWTRPIIMAVHTTTDGRQFSLAAEAPCRGIVPEDGPTCGFANAHFTPRPARLIRIKFAGEAGRGIGVDEVVMYPAPGPLWGSEYEIEGLTTGDDTQSPAHQLTDGRLSRDDRTEGALRCTADGASVRFDLEAPLYLSRALAHANWNDAAGRPSCRATLHTQHGKLRTRTTPVRGVGEGWAVIDVPLRPAPAISFELSGGPGVAWDELTVFPPRNLAINMPYRTEPAFPAKYPDSDHRELTDGLLSERGFEDGRTVGWWTAGAARSVIVDLGAPLPLDAVRAHVQGGGYAAVRYPASMDVSAFDNGRWRLLATDEPRKTVVFSEQTDGENNELAWLTQPLNTRRARLLKIDFGPSAYGWLMISEIQILSGERNVARGCSYYLMPRPSSDAKYADDGAFLTDGARPHWNLDSAVGWHDADPTITVDLLGPRDIGMVGAWCLGGGRWGVFFPERITVETSLDGAAWSQPVEMQLPAQAQNGTADLAFLTTDVPAQTARFIRLHVQPRGWAMIHEVEVYTPSKSVAPGTSAAH